MCVFVDLKVAFDSVDRGRLIKAMREREIREGLIMRLEEIIDKSKSKVKVEGEVKKGFWTARGLRQGCSLQCYSIL